MRGKKRILEDAEKDRLTKKEKLFLELLLDIRDFQRHIRDKLVNKIE